MSVTRTKSSSFISQVHALPSGVIGHVLTYIPRNDTAQLVHDAWRRGDLRLKYLRRLQISNSDLNAEMLRGLAPSVCGSNVYGDDDAQWLSSAPTSRGGRARSALHTCPLLHRIDTDSQRSVCAGVEGVADDYQ